jgi:hypothetical protein
VFISPPEQDGNRLSGDHRAGRSTASSRPSGTPAARKQMQGIGHAFEFVIEEVCRGTALDQRRCTESLAVQLAFEEW